VNRAGSGCDEVKFSHLFIKWWWGSNSVVTSYFTLIMNWRK